MEAGLMQRHVAELRVQACKALRTRSINTASLFDGILYGLVELARTGSS